MTDEAEAPAAGDNDPARDEGIRAKTRSLEIGWEFRWGLWAVLILTILQSLVAKPFYIPSGSMTPTPCTAGSTTGRRSPR